MRRISILLLFTTLCGCAEARIKESWQQFSVASQDCGAKKQRGEFKTFHELAMCTNAAAIATRGQYASEAGEYDLLMRENAYRLQLGDARDRGLSQAEADTKWAAFGAGIVADAQKRKADEANAQAQMATAIIASGALRPQPQPPPPPIVPTYPTQRSINCTSMGAGNAVYTNCN
jgi:hypothetical protein